MQIAAFSTFDAAYLAVLGHLTRCCHNPADGCLNVSFTLTEPRARMLFSPRRCTNIVAAWGQVLWHLQARNDPAMIGYYLPEPALRGTRSSLTGVAYGQKIFQRPAAGCPSQWEQVIARLTNDPATDRGVIALLDPAGDPEASRVLALQFLVRGGRLHSVVYARAGDVMADLPGDVFTFTVIAELAAHHLGVGLGSYTHHTGALTLQTADAGVAEEILTTQADIPGFTAPVMPATSWPDLLAIADREGRGRLRRGEDPIHPGGLGRTALDPYWAQVLLLFEVYRQITGRPDHPVDHATLAALDPCHQWLIAQRWPAGMPDGFVPPSPPLSEWAGS